MYGKIIDGILQYAPETITFEGKTVCNPTDDQLSLSGYYPIQASERPGDNYTPTYRLDGGAIVQEWVEVPEQPPTPEQQAVTFLSSMVSTYTTLTDAQALAMPDILPTWQEFLDSGREIPSGVCLMHDGQCYRQAQNAPIKPEAQRPPGSPGMSAVYRPVVSGHAGTLDDPIPWVYEMDCKKGKYYSYKGKIYLCTGDMSPCVWEPGEGAPQWEEVA